MNFQSNFSLKKYNTFGIDVKAKNFVSLGSKLEIKELLDIDKNIFLISGGSNMLLTKDIEKTVAHINLKGIKIIEEDDDSVLLEVSAGEDWHNFVLWCVERDYGGIENLSLIPGNVGTCPIQNIGAYGVEVKDVITAVKAIEIDTSVEKSFTNVECKFGYRNSVFKNELKNKFIITAVLFRLSKRNHKLNTSYGAIGTQLKEMGKTSPGIKDISDAVIVIRQSKLPDPKKIGNSGSFFKNPIVKRAHFEKIQSDFSEIPSYPVDADNVKVPAGWLIEKAGFKGKRFGDAGVHEKQALVLVNHGNASGVEIYNVARSIQDKIASIFGIHLEMEVNVF